MPVGNPATSSIPAAATAAVISLNSRSNSPFQMVPCSPYIGTVTHGMHNSPAPLVPNVRALAMTPDIGHMVPQTPDIGRNGIPSNWTNPSSKGSSISHGEQLVPQTPLSSSYDYHDHRDRGHATSHISGTSNTPRRETHRERRQLPNSPMMGVQQQQPQATTSQFELFSGDDIFG